MTSETAIIIGSVLGSLPAWGALGMSIYTQRSALPKQTNELKAHFDTTAAAPAAMPEEGAYFERC